MKTFELAGKTYSVQGELPNGFFYLEGPRGGDAVFAKPAGGIYVFTKAKGGAAVYSDGVLVTANRSDLVDPRVESGCFCPSDCGCKSDYRATVCGCTGRH